RQTGTSAPRAGKKSGPRKPPTSLTSRGIRRPPLPCAPLLLTDGNPFDATGSLAAGTWLILSPFTLQNVSGLGRTIGNARRRDICARRRAGKKTERGAGWAHDREKRSTHLCKTRVTDRFSPCPHLRLHENAKTPGLESGRDGRAANARTSPAPF